MREVETQAVGLDERTLLRHVVAQRLAQGFMQQMRRRMMLAVARAAGMIDIELDRLAGLERSLFEDALMDDEIADPLLRVGDAEQRALSCADHAVIAGLAARFAIERRLVDHQRAFVSLLELGHFLALGNDRPDDAFGLLGVVAQELRSPDALADVEPDRVGLGLARAFPRLARILALLRHGPVEGLRVDADAARLQRVLRQIEREAIGVIELEGRLAGEDMAFGERA